MAVEKLTKHRSSRDIGFVGYSFSLSFFSGLSGTQMKPLSSEGYSALEMSSNSGIALLLSFLWRFDKIKEVHASGSYIAIKIDATHPEWEIELIDRLLGWIFDAEVVDQIIEM